MFYSQLYKFSIIYKKSDIEKMPLSKNNPIKTGKYRNICFFGLFSAFFPKGNLLTAYSIQTRSLGHREQQLFRLPLLLEPRSENFF